MAFVSCFRLVLNVEFPLPALLEDLQFITLKVNYFAEEQCVIWVFVAIYRN